MGKDARKLTRLERSIKRWLQWTGNATYKTIAESEEPPVTPEAVRQSVARIAKRFKCSPKQVLDAIWRNKTLPPKSNQ